MEISELVPSSSSKSVALSSSKPLFIDLSTYITHHFNIATCDVRPSYFIAHSLRICDALMYAQLKCLVHHILLFTLCAHATLQCYINYRQCGLASTTLFSVLVILLCSSSFLSHTLKPSSTTRPNIVYCNLHHLLHCGMVNYTNKCCNLCCLFQRGMVDDTNKYGSAAIYTIYFTMTWSTTRTNMEVLVSFQLFLHMVNNTKSCVGNSLVCGSLRLSQISANGKACTCSHVTSNLDTYICVTL